MTTITRSDVEQYVRDTLPYDELSDWDIDAIIDDMLAEWPDLIGRYSGEAMLHLGPNRLIEHKIDSDKYWQIVKRHQSLLEEGK